MRKLMAAILVFATLPLAAGGGDFLQRMHLGAEWGLSANLVDYHHFNYLDSSIGFRIDDSGWRGHYTQLGFVRLTLGCDVSRFVSICVSGSYEGISRGRRIMPVSLRAGLFPSGVHEEGIFFFSEAGTGMRRNERGVRLYQLGSGYRIVLDARRSLDFKLGAQVSHDRPRVWDPVEEEYIPERNILRNNAWYYALNMAVALEF